MPEPTAKSTAGGGPASTFNDQALVYGVRAGLPSTVGSLVARSIMDRAGAGPDDLVVELGAGTGEIGVHLLRLPVRYIGLDASVAMLDVFRAKAAEALPSLVVADCNQPWPLPDGSAATVFASRVIHLLEPDHVARETTRVCRPAGYLILGRVLREPEGVKERLRRQRQQLLLEAGISPRQSDAGARRVVERCVVAGGESLGRRVVAEWTGESAPATVIDTWETMSRMGSFPVEPVTRTKILTELRHWAGDEIGNLDRPRAFRERYAFDIVRLP
ncbi:MAG: class I SAM-dependent methyltransferase [Chloroflexota bacterium]|nr:class I SAM-dependent methyltransferase [Chloroflexota bacterium]